jgi:hypothetical protein
MTGLTDYSADNVLNYIVGKTAMPSLPTTYLALFTAIGTDAGTGFTEVSGGSYARVALAGDWNAASGSSPSAITNSATITFPTPTANWGTVIAWGIYDASSGGNLLAWDYLGNFSWLPAFVTLASPGVLDVKANGYSNGDSVVFSTEYGGTAPSFSQSNFTGLLTVANAATDSFTVTNSSTAVNTSSTGSGMVRKVASQSVATNVVVSFAASSFTLSAA